MNDETLRSDARRQLLKAGIALGALLPAAAALADDKPKGADAEDTRHQTVTVEQHGAVIRVGLNRLEADNRIDPTTYGALARTYYAFEHDPTLRVMVLHAHGDHFCKGIDVEAFAPSIHADKPMPTATDVLDPFGKTKPRLTKPVVVVVHGSVWNIGHELCLASDIRIASADTDFAQTEATQGRFPGSGATVRFVRDAGWGQAMRYMLTGDHWSAEEAKRMGLIQEVAPDKAAALARGLAIAEKIAAAAPLSVKATLASAHLALEVNEDAALSDLNRQRQALYAMKDFQEGLRASKERRQPDFHGE